MFGIDWQELLVIVFVAVLVIGPRDLPRAMRTAGQWIGKIRRTSNHFRAGIEAMIREAEMEEMEKKWAEQNAKIMAEHPGQPELGEHEMRPLPGPDAESAVPPPASDDEPQLPLPKRPPD
jgi:sec-independent protein translocase protein TatB